MLYKSEKVIPLYRNGKGIYEALAELEKGQRELSKYTLEEQMELLKKMQKKQIDSAVVEMVDTARCLRVASFKRGVCRFESFPQSQLMNNYLGYDG